MNHYYSTQSIPESERIACWQEWVGRVFVSLNVSQGNQSSFFGSIGIQPLGFAELVVVDSVQQFVQRKILKGSSSEEELFMLVFQAKGTTFFRQDDREVKLLPGHWTLLDSTRLYEIHSAGYFQHLVMSVPQSYVSEWHGVSKEITATNLFQLLPLGEVVSEHLRLLYRNLDQVCIEERSILGDSILKLISAALGRLIHKELAVFPEKNKVELIKSYIERHLRDPELSVGLIAENLNVSKRYIHKLFDNQNLSVSEYIRKLRLENCCRELCDVSQPRKSITDVALEWGFNSPAHFSTLFKKQYGDSPRGYLAKKINR